MKCNYNLSSPGISVVKTELQPVFIKYMYFKALKALK